MLALGSAWFRERMGRSFAAGLLFLGLGIRLALFHAR